MGRRKVAVAILILFAIANAGCAGLPTPATQTPAPMALCSYATTALEHIGQARAILETGRGHIGDTNQLGKDADKIFQISNTFGKLPVPEGGSQIGSLTGSALDEMASTFGDMKQGYDGSLHAARFLDVLQQDMTEIDRVRQAQRCK